MNRECSDPKCSCVCHHPLEQPKKLKPNRVFRNIGCPWDYECSDVYYILDRFQTENHWIPSNMFKAAKAITRTKEAAAKSTDKKQKLLWGQLLFYVYHQNENIHSPDYLYPSGQLKLDGRLVSIYINEWLIPHRAGIAKLKATRHKRIKKQKANSSASKRYFGDYSEF